MIVLIISFYALIFGYDIVKLYHNNLKREIPIYIVIMSISVVISSLVALKIDIVDPMIYFRKFLELLKSALGG
ncbi:hypothetical protein [Haloimpatiens lingqiaonensis]|uniref:hypothetical protein n=1 Tax=Haloimpatiens lingqiaonensis TaxID=1380675 RepID=UPI0010FF499F|nr:hypothetical protein [Haloimpatiens lingqiaonensis]